MSMQNNRDTEQEAAIAFSRQSVVFDKLYAPNGILWYKRKRVRDHVLQLLKPNSSILELNAGTGEDAVFFAQRGHHVHATDIAVGMQERLMEKVSRHKLTDKITNELCSYTALSALVNKGPYDCIFSNFAGLNCTDNLQQVLDSFDLLSKPGGTIVLVILPRFCLWETMLVLKGKWRTATRRFFSGNGRKATIDGSFFTCWYYSPSFIINRLKHTYQLLQLEGLCTIVPPSYIEHFAEKHPALFSRLCKMEDRFKNKWPWKSIGDYYIISMQKKA